VGYKHVCRYSKNALLLTQFLNSEIPQCLANKLSSVET